jgi:predicted Abi (CAAX) family protease
MRRAAISTLVFVLGHLLIPGERQQKTFRDPGFLIMCGIFGAMCSAVYYLTGSLLVIWLVHGVPVTVWLLLLGGVDKVQ